MSARTLRRLGALRSALVFAMWEDDRDLAHYLGGRHRRIARKARRIQPW